MNHQRMQVGLDIGQNALEVSVLRPEGQEPICQRSFANSRSGYQQLRQVLLALLQSHNYTGLDIGGEATGYYWLPLFWALQQDEALGAYDLQTYLLNPHNMYWFRRAQAEAEKTDAKDSYHLAERLRTQSHGQPWQPDQLIFRLRLYSRYRFHLGKTISALKNYFWSLMFLWCSGYHPHTPFSDGLGACGRALVREYSDWQTLLNLPAEALRDRLAACSRGQIADPERRAKRLQALLRESFIAPADITPALHDVLTLLLDHLEHLQTQSRQVEKTIQQEIAEHHPGAQSLLTIPGIGVVLAAGITAEIGNLDRFLAQPKWDARKKRYRPRNLRDAEDAVAKYAGLWWPRRESGSFRGEDRRLSKQGNKYLRYHLVTAAERLRQHLPEYQAYYQRKYQEATTHRHQRAIVLTARKSVGLFVGLLHRQEPYRSPEV